MALRSLRIATTVLFALALGQAGFGSGLAASLITRPKSEALETAHLVNAYLVVTAVVVCLVASLLLRRDEGTSWPLWFAVALLVVVVLQIVLGTQRVVGAHLYLGVLYLCAVTTYCSYAWRHRPASDRVTTSR